MKSRDLREVHVSNPTTPGAYLQHVLTEHGVTQAELAERTGLSAKHVNQLIKGRANISASSAGALELVTGVAAHIWLRMEADVQAASVVREERGEVVRSAAAREWFHSFDIGELVRRGLIADADREHQIEQLLRFFGVAKPEAWATHWLASLPRFRRSPAFTPEQLPTTVWLRIGQLKARSIRTEPFDGKRLQGRLDELRQLTRTPDLDTALDDAVNVCASVGVALAFAAEIPGCRASGAAWWADKGKAVVLLSDRGKREDRLWFSLFHELGHVLLHHRRDTFLDQVVENETEQPPWQSSGPPPLDRLIIDDSSRDSALEIEADDFAQNALIPAEYVAELSQATTKKQLQRIARDVGVSDGVVVGRWQYENGTYRRFNELRRPLPAERFLAPPHAGPG